ncbi:MAG: hypothetical protein UIC64_04900 [Agathobacter sp.]|nr:hypothetical protein [Agathobacter sp.]
MERKTKFQYWNNMQIEILKEYPTFRKCKIRILYTGSIITVDISSIVEEREEAISVSWLEG